MNGKNAFASNRFYINKTVVIGVLLYDNLPTRWLRSRLPVSIVSLQHRSTDHYENRYVYEYFCGESFFPIIFVEAPNAGEATAYQLLHRSINRQVVNVGAKNDANLALSATFRYVSIETPL
ncbi:uncharacterized protein TNCV_3506881 [Trichonephila clavipes]|uniref:Uncharacterized protein n=1 Tax=Trichonephila clavipes TaxID=2585209 RepID=A0A8X6S984_TRICX|nr:uncharacterized protein TNCV_3506881 [Trichonephila clavipes]